MGWAGAELRWESPQGPRTKTSLLLSKVDLTRMGTGMARVCVCVLRGQLLAKGCTLTVQAADVVSWANKLGHLG